MAFARTLTVSHATTATGADDPDKEINKDQWNENHTASSLLSGATSGGIPYFDSTTTEASSALLAATAPVLGGGSGAAPTTDGSTYLLGNAHQLISRTANIMSLTRTSDNVGTNLYLGNIVALGNGLQINTGNTYASQGNRVGFFGIGPGPGTQSTVAFATAGMVGWTNSATEAYAAFDSAFSRVSAGVIGVGTGAAGSVAGKIRGLYQSSDGTDGVAAFGPAGVASITIKNGLVVAIS